MKKLFKLTEKDLEMVSGGTTIAIIRSTVFGIKNNIPVVAPIGRAVSNISNIISRRHIVNHSVDEDDVEFSKKCHYYRAVRITNEIAYGVAGTITGLLPGVVGFMLGKRALNSHSSDKKTN